MSSTSLITILVAILAVILVDVFCGDITSSRQTNQWQNNQNSEQRSPDVLPNSKSTTPWPALGQRSTSGPGSNNNRRTSRPATQSPKKWIQQNNIWIKNEQASSGGNGGGPPHNSETGTNKGVKSTIQQHRLSENIPNAASLSTSTKPPLKRGETYTVLKPQIHQSNRQQALINGLGGNQQNLGVSDTKIPNQPVSSTTSKPTVPTNKPMSYAGAVDPKHSSPSPKTPPGSPPLSPEIGDPKKDKLPFAGPADDHVEDLDADKETNTANTDSSATDDELREFSETLLRKDTNNAMKYVTLNLQGMTSSRSPSDEAPLPLLKIDDAAYKIPSIEKIILLYNNYFLEAGQNEVYTGQERIEENNLLDTILATPVMQFARSFLVQKDKIGKDPKEFRDLLRRIWFNMYSRGNGRIGSSGFEHVFLAEIKNSQVSGLHNWLYFNEEESQKRANYLGYMKKLDLGEKGAVLKYHFTFHDIDKPVGSMFIGTSPELEIALYTTCFVLRADRICPLKMNGNRFIIRTYTYRYRGKNMIGSAFPEI